MKVVVVSLMIFFSSVNLVSAQELNNTQESIVTDLSYTYLDTLVSLAKKNYPQTRIAALQTKEAKTNIGKTNVSWLDAFTLSYYYIPGNNNALNPNNTYFFNGYQVGINFNIGTLLEKPFNNKEAKEQYKIAQDNQQEYDLTIEAEVKKRYFTYIQQQALLRLRTKSTSDAAIVASTLQHKFETGGASYIDYTRAVSAETDQNQYLIAAQSDALIAKASLEEIIGVKLENIH
ncbi:MAG TPA: TolC family protein [Ferruginibacter sp.]|nr:TolC family protein [Ferruginibacter sp.]